MAKEKGWGKKERREEELKRSHFTLVKTGRKVREFMTHLGLTNKVNYLTTYFEIISGFRDPRKV